MNPDTPKPMMSDEISLYDLLVSIKHWVRFVFRRWIVFALCIGIGIATMLLWRSQKEPIYHAELTLMLNDDGGSSFSGLSGILGQFGIAVNSGRYNIDKLIEIARSRRIIYAALEQKSEINGTTDFLANHIIRSYELDQHWSKKFESTPEEYLFKENFRSNHKELMLKKLYSLIVGTNGTNGILSTDYGRDHYIMTFSMDSPVEELSISFLTHHFNSLKDFYISKSIEKQEQTYNIVKTKHDSLYQALQVVEGELATLKDASLGSFSSRSSNRQSQLATESLILKTAYAKSVENLAIAELALQNRTPLIQAIDFPASPIDPSRPSLVKSVLFGMVLGVSTALLYYFIQFIIKL